MTAIQICALISLITGAAILYWTGYRGGLTDGKNDGYEDGHSDGFTMGQDDASAAYARSIEKVSTRCQRLENIAPGTTRSPRPSRHSRKAQASR